MKRRKTLWMTRQNVREVHRKTDLSADSGARDVFTSQHAEIESETSVNCVLTADHSLQLTSSQAHVIRDSSIDLTS